MQTLEILYEENHKNTFFADRKISISQKKTLLLGPRKSGKTHLIFDYLSQYDKESYLYIDFSDVRVEKEIIIEHLPHFLATHPIRLLVLEHFDFSFELPNLTEIIITTTFTCKELQGFYTQTLYPLDFEEFIAFDKKHSNIEQLFNLYSNHGTFAHIHQLIDADHYRHLQAMLHLLLPEASHFAIYKRFCELQGSKITLFQIYNQLKPFMKLSKDKLYAITTKLIENNLLFLVEKYQQPNASKKVFLLDYAFKDAITFKKDFLKRFENMIFLELIKRHKKVYYEEGIDFYLPDESLAILCVGFATTKAIELRLQKLLPTFWGLHVKRVEVVTLSSESAKDIEGFSFSIQPFWEWALQL